MRSNLFVYGKIIKEPTSIKAFLKAYLIKGSIRDLISHHSHQKTDLKVNNSPWSQSLMKLLSGKQK